MNKELISRFLEDKNKQLNVKIEEFRCYLVNQSKICNSSIDASNIAGTCATYAKDIAKLEGELQQLQLFITLE